MRQWWYKQSKTNCLLMWIEQSLGPSERSHLLCVITCFLKRNTVPSQQLFPICLEWSGWDATVFFFFSRGIWLLQCIYICFKWNQRCFLYHFLVMGVMHGMGYITIKSDHPWGFSEHHSWPIWIIDLYSWRKFPQGKDIALYQSGL